MTYATQQGTSKRQSLQMLRAVVVANVGDVPESEWQLFESACDLVHLGAREVMIPAETHHQFGYYLAEGLVKVVRTGEHPSTVAFLPEGSVVVLLAAYQNAELARALRLGLVPGFPAQSSGLFETPLEVVTIEPVVALRVDLRMLDELAVRSRTWARVRTMVLRAHVLVGTQIIAELRDGPAERRYRLFTKAYPDLVRRLTQKEIASYLDVSPVTLSRLVARLHLRGKR